MKILKSVQRDYEGTDEIEFTKGYLEGSLREALKRGNLIGQPITDSLKAEIARRVDDHLQALFEREHKFEIDVRGNENNQIEVNVGWDEKFDNKMKVEEKKKEVEYPKERRKHQTTMEEDFLSFLIGE